ncbi:HypC/HybG/HupF family hydrogenase formation chaperone [Streptomyces sp. NPDC006691]|uniref:HypC/HybG/HupF family hydrogenase formation chaperone n=1 Tax=Streptomyces sp. NPDC006691 TaxID=3364757 RepID=UPI00367A396F
MATVGFGGVRREVCLAPTPTASGGRYVIVHVGFAITEVSPTSTRPKPDEPWRSCAPWPGRWRTSSANRCPGPADPAGGAGRPCSCPRRPLGRGPCQADAAYVNWRMREPR